MGSHHASAPRGYAIQPVADQESATAGVCTKAFARRWLAPFRAAARRDGRDPPPLKALRQELDACEKFFISWEPSTRAYGGLAGVRFGRLGNQYCCFATVWLPTNEAHHAALVQAMREECMLRVDRSRRKTYAISCLTTYAIFLRVADGRDVLVPDG